MIVLSVVNNKGGVGKTKVVSLISEYLAKYHTQYKINKKILLVDLDAQCNLSSCFLEMENDPYAKEGLLPPVHPQYDLTEEEQQWDGRSNIANIFFGEPVIPYSTYVDHIDILPAHASKLLEAEAVRKDEVLEKIVQLFSDLIHHRDVTDLYDMVIIDTGPSKGPLTRAAIRASSHILIPSVMEIKCIQGIYGMMQLWRQENFLRESSNPLKLVGILPNKFKANTSLHQSLLAELKAKDNKISEYVMPMELPDRIIFAETDFKQANPKTIFDLPENDKIRIQAIEACHFIMEKVNHA